MSLNSLIINTLSPLGIPVSFQKYSGSAPTYITFFCYNERGEAWAENKEIATGFYIQVDVWSKGDYTTVVDRVKELLETAGFNRTFSTELYEDETATFHKVMRLVYVN